MGKLKNRWSKHNYAILCLWLMQKILCLWYPMTYSWYQWYQWYLFNLPRKNLPLHQVLDHRSSSYVGDLAAVVHKTQRQRVQTLRFVADNVRNSTFCWRGVDGTLFGRFFCWVSLLFRCSGCLGGGMDFCRLENLQVLYLRWEFPNFGFASLRIEVLHPGAPQFIYLLHEAARKAVIDVAGSCFRIDVCIGFSVGGRIVKRRESTLGTTCWSTWGCNSWGVLSSVCQASGFLWRLCLQKTSACFQLHLQKESWKVPVSEKNDCWFEVGVLTWSHCQRLGRAGPAACAEVG